jgi:Uma2 family endonuclease
VYHPDVDYVDGCIEERKLGENDHSKWQMAIQLWFSLNAEAWRVLVRPELRIRTSGTRYRVGDVSILDADHPQERIPTYPPLAIFEVLSPEDRISRVKVRLADFAVMGVPEIWLINPETGSFDRFEDGQLVGREEFAIAGRGIVFAVSQIAKLVR